MVSPIDRLPPPTPHPTLLRLPPEGSLRVMVDDLPGSELGITLSPPLPVFPTMDSMGKFFEVYKEFLMQGNMSSNVTAIMENIQKILERRRKTAELCGSQPLQVSGAVAAAVSMGGNDTVGLDDKNDLDWSEFLEAFRFWGSGVTVAAMAAVGLVGNLISIITILSMKKRNLFHNLLLTLTIFDTIFIVNGGLFFMQRAFRFRNVVYDFLFARVIYPLAGISMTGSTYTCLAIALERYLGICYAQSDFLIRKTRYYIITIIAIAIVIDSPRKEQMYVQIYTMWFRLAFTAAGPFLLMLFFNTKILIYYNKNRFASSGDANRAANVGGGGGSSIGGSGVMMQAGGGSLRRLQPQVSVVSNAPSGSGSSGANNGNNVAQERVLYLTFFCLTATFLLCHGPRCILNIFEMPVNSKRRLCTEVYKVKFREPSWMLIASSVEKILLIFQSSINFVYYCLVGKSFRQHMFKAILPAKFARWFFRTTGVDLLGATTTAATGETTMGGTGTGADYDSCVAGGGRRSRRHRNLSCSLDQVSYAADEKRASYFQDMMAHPSLRATAEEEIGDEDEEEEEQQQEPKVAEVILEPSGRTRTTIEINSPVPSSSSSSSSSDDENDQDADEEDDYDGPASLRGFYERNMASISIAADPPSSSPSGGENGSLIGLEGASRAISPGGVSCSKGSQCEDICSCDDRASSDDDDDDDEEEGDDDEHDEGDDGDGGFVKVGVETVTKSSQTDLSDQVRITMEGDDDIYDGQDAGGESQGSFARSMSLLTAFLTPSRSHHGSRSNSGSSAGSCSHHSSGSNSHHNHNGRRAKKDRNPPVFV